MTIPPGIRRVNPDEEAARLARDRLDPPGREWGIRHPGGKITVFIDGHAFGSRLSAETERTGRDQDCDTCNGGPHVLVCRDRQQWREP